MPSMTEMMSPILAEEALMRPMVFTTSPTTLPPRRATSAAVSASWLAWRAESALWVTLAVSCSMAEAVCSRLAAACSVRWLRSWLPTATSREAVAMLSVAWRTPLTTVASEPCMAATPRITAEVSSRPCTVMDWLRS